MVIGVVQLAHETIDVGRSVPSNIRNEEGDKFWRNIVKDWTVNINLR